MDDFSTLGIKKDVLEVLKSLKFSKPTEVQEKIIPLLNTGKNIVFTSRTGSGKTLAYALPFLAKINKKFGVQMIILVPTRELCIQVGKELKQLCDMLSFNVGVLYGGREIQGDRKTLIRKNQIIVGTPGRLIQHVNQKSLRVGDCAYLVFDESDQMFDDGFYGDCSYMVNRVSKNAQLVLASATITDKVHNFINHKIQTYELVRVGEEIPSSIVQEKIYCDKSDKKPSLLHALRARKFKRAMVFCNTKRKTEIVAEFLQKDTRKAAFLTGDLDQKDRTNTLNLFKEGKINVIVTTDVAARGLNIPSVDIVVNYDIPTRPEFYVHRIGRTGRVGAAGYSLAFVCPEDEERFKHLEEDYSLNVIEIDFAEEE